MTTQEILGKITNAQLHEALKDAPDALWKECYLPEALAKSPSHDFTTVVIDESEKVQTIKHHEGWLLVIVPANTHADIIRISESEKVRESHAIILVGRDATVNYSSLFAGEKASQNASETLILMDNATVNANFASTAQKAMHGVFQLIMFGKESTTHTALAFALGEGDKHTYSVDNIFVGKGNSGTIRANGVLEDHAHAAIEGKIRIMKDANQTDSSLAEKIILLGKNSVASAKPIIAIDTDDVKAGHGASITQIQEEDMFYIQSRGLNKKEAHDLLKNAFLKEVFGTLDPNHPFFELIEKHI